MAKRGTLANFQRVVAVSRKLAADFVARCRRSLLQPYRLQDLDEINRHTVQRAGPRYSPGLDPSAPNLEIPALIEALEAVSLSGGLKSRLRDVADDLLKLKRRTPRGLFDVLGPELLEIDLGAALLQQLSAALPKVPKSLIEQIQRASEALTEGIGDYESELLKRRDEQGLSDESRRELDRQLDDVGELRSNAYTFRALVTSASFQLIENRFMLIKGTWGSGKTHLLCDVVRKRSAVSLPSLMFLAQTFGRGLDPLDAAAAISSLGPDWRVLLGRLDRAGAAACCRALLIVDGINEGDREAWAEFVRTASDRLRTYPNVALVLSCRTPFDEQIFDERGRADFVEIWHQGFDDIEFDAQREFFKYYKIPNPHVPLLAPEFSKPLFLKILCESLREFTSRTKKKKVKDFASGQKGMTKLLEDFVVHIGRAIELDFGLVQKGCWRLLKGTGDGGDAVGLAPRMAELGQDYLTRPEAIEIAVAVTGKPPEVAADLLVRLSNDGLLIEDAEYNSGGWTEVVRLPYQRFSDHLIARHLIARYLNTSTEESVRRSFYKSAKLGQVFAPDKTGYHYRMPGLASAIMLEFPERVKRVLPAEKRELMYYLPKNSQKIGLIAPFIEGLLWRSVDSFSAQTDRLVGRLLEIGSDYTKKQILEVIVCLASRVTHPYDSIRLRNYLATMPIVERDLFWSEFLRSRDGTSCVWRVLDWIVDGGAEGADRLTTERLVQLCALFLTSTVRPLRDRATRCLVELGQHHPDTLFDVTLWSLSFSDPYVPERTLAATYGMLMRTWAFPPPRLSEQVIPLATELQRRLVGSSSEPPIEHYLMRDYSDGIIELARKLSAKSRRDLRTQSQRPSKRSIFPSVRRISAASVMAAKPALHMDFENYTVGRLIPDRRNYDYKQREYVQVKKLISWRILNLGYDSRVFEAADRAISHGAYSRQDDGGKTERYGKKYSWIAYYEVAGRRDIEGKHPNEDRRISDADIDPSFPRPPELWNAELPNTFQGKYVGRSEWLADGPAPDYGHLLAPTVLNEKKGPWVLLQGYVAQAASSDPSADPRKIFTFLRGMFVEDANLERLRDLFNSREYPGNRNIPEPGEDHYTFAGEIGWSNKYGGYLRRKDGRARPQLEEALEEIERWSERKRYADLTAKERGSVVPKVRLRLFGLEGEAEESDVDDADGMVTLSFYRTIPGVKVELPSWGYGWESYHSVENKGANPDYPAPYIVEKLGLRKRGEAVDLVDPSGRGASLYLEYGEPFAPCRCRLLYLRRDLLEEYCRLRKMRFVWLNWGERELHHDLAESLREDPQIQQLWQRHAHIHKQFVSLPMA